MTCEECGKAPAKVHMTEIMPDNEKRERHLCEKCAEKLGYTVKHYSLSELLAGIAASQKKAEAPDLKCPSCGLTFAQFQATGRFGCAEDYDAFAEHIQARIERYHDAQKHVGKVPRDPGRSGAAADLRRLRSRLREAVGREDYETAARLRDDMRRIEEGGA